jgi:hypothetical protein
MRLQAQQQIDGVVEAGKQRRRGVIRSVGLVISYLLSE